MVDNNSLVKRITAEINEFIKLTNLFSQETIIGQRTILGERKHLAFWHRYYAANLAALGKKIKQPLFKEKYIDLEKRCEVEMANYNFNELAELMLTDQKAIAKIINNGLSGELKYKYGSRLYTVNDYLNTILDHIKSHNSYIIKELKVETK